MYFDCLAAIKNLHTDLLLSVYSENNIICFFFPVITCAASATARFDLYYHSIRYQRTVKITLFAIFPVIMCAASATARFDLLYHSIRSR